MTDQTTMRPGATAYRTPEFLVEATTTTEQATSLFGRIAARIRNGFAGARDGYEAAQRSRATAEIRGHDEGEEYNVLDSYWISSNIGGYPDIHSPTSIGVDGNFDPIGRGDPSSF